MFSDRKLFTIPWNMGTTLYKRSKHLKRTGSDYSPLDIKNATKNVRFHIFRYSFLTLWLIKIFYSAQVTYKSLNINVPGIKSQKLRSNSNQYFSHTKYPYKYQLAACLICQRSCVNIYTYWVQFPWQNYFWTLTWIQSRNTQRFDSVFPDTLGNYFSCFTDSSYLCFKMYLTWNVCPFSVKHPLKGLQFLHTVGLQCRSFQSPCDPAASRTVALPPCQTGRSAANLQPPITYKL